MSETTVDNGKRTWLIATGCAGAVGGAAVAVPFISTFSPSERAHGIHGGDIETSLMMAFRPDLVREEECADFQSANAEMERSFLWLRGHWLARLPSLNVGLEPQQFHRHRQSRHHLDLLRLPHR